VVQGPDVAPNRGSHALAGAAALICSSVIFWPIMNWIVSRYDAFLYTHTTATLAYQKTPVLVQVSLLHKGGLAGGASATHADAVLRGVQEYVDQFATRIHDANK